METDDLVEGARADLGHILVDQLQTAVGEGEGLGRLVAEPEHGAVADHDLIVDGPEHGFQ